VASVQELGESDQMLLGRLLLTCARIARDKGLSESGCRFVANTGRDGGQTVFHLHFHVMGGRHMGWPPG
jgi:histidine triad (HIT) family protein